MTATPLHPVPAPGELLHLAGAKNARAMLLLSLAEDHPDGDLDLPTRTEVARLSAVTIPAYHSGLLFGQLRDAVVARTDRLNNSDRLPVSEAEALDNQVMHVLYRLLHGVPECPRCLGPALTIDQINPAEVDCGCGVVICRSHANQGTDDLLRAVDAVRDVPALQLVPMRPAADLRVLPGGRAS